MDVTGILQVLRTMMVVMGLVTLAWGVYDIFGEGQQTSMGIKKIFGGVAFAIIAGLVLTWAIGEVQSVQAGIGGGGGGGSSGGSTISVIVQTWFLPMFRR